MYRIQLDEFEGPLDLLLYFIQRDELDIYNIPIAQITDEFLGYVRVMEEIDLDGVGDFIYFAALLINIKVRMLLPRPELDEEGEPIDPRRELVERLLEYIRYKEAAQALADEHERRGDFFTRGAAAAQEHAFRDETPEMLVNTTLFDLIGALRRVLTEANEPPLHEIEHVEYSISEQRAYVVGFLQQHGKSTFLDLARHRHKGFIISTFLAVLELTQLGDLALSRTAAADDFYVALAEGTPAAVHGAVELHGDA